MITKNFHLLHRTSYLRSLYKNTSSGLKMLNVSILTLLVTACQVEIAPVDNLTPESTLSGSVGDGPITQAQITVSDANGFTLGSAISNTSASYSIIVPQGTYYPVLVKATGGTDVVTGAEPDFTMISVAQDSSATTVNINPFSTLIVKTAQAMSGGLTDHNISLAKQFVVDNFSFGLDPVLVQDPIKTPVTETNVGSIIKSSEAFGETIRRTHSALQSSGSNLTENEIIDTLAADMTDGKIDGRGPGASDQVAATVNAVSGQVLVEALGNHLNVGGTEATTRMDIAINMSSPNATITTADVIITDKMLTQTKKSIAAAQEYLPSSKLSALAVVLATLSGNSMSAVIDSLLPVNAGSAFDEVITQIPFGNTSQFEIVNASVRTGNIGIASTPDPILTPTSASGAFNLSKSTYSVGESDGLVNITINRVGGSDGSVTVEWRTLTFNGNGTADYTTDYGSVPLTLLTFDDGEASKTLPITINSDSVVEGNETFSVFLSNPAGGATVGTLTASTVTIIDDDVATQPINNVVSQPVAVDEYPVAEVLTSATIKKPVSNPNGARPDYRVPMLDATFGSYVTRITDANVFGTSNLRHRYSKNQTWNIDGSLIKIRGFLIDGRTYEKLGKYGMQDEERWSNTDPNVMYGVRGNIFRKYIVSTNQWTNIRSFTGYERCYIGAWQGNIDNSDRFISLACRKPGEATADKPNHAVVYDIVNDKVLADKTFTRPIKWISMSQSGEYVVLRWFDDSATKVQVFDRNLNFVRNLVERTAHGDLTYDSFGDEVYVQHNGAGYLTSYRLSDGQERVILKSNLGLRVTDDHISCRSVKRPGWCYISTTTSDELIAVKLDGSQTVERFAHHRTTYTPYDAQAQGVVSPDGTKMMFASNWDGSAPEINSYVVEMKKPSLN